MNGVPFFATRCATLRCAALRLLRCGHPSLCRIALDQLVGGWTEMR